MEYLGFLAKLFTAKAKIKSFPKILNRKVLLFLRIKIVEHPGHKYVKKILC